MSSYYSSQSRTPIQVIEGRNVDQNRLYSVLKDVYGENDGKSNFHVKLRRNRYKIYSSESAKLTQAQIDKCRVYHR